MWKRANHHLSKLFAVSKLIVLVPLVLIPTDNWIHILASKPNDFYYKLQVNLLRIIVLDLWFYAIVKLIFDGLGFQGKLSLFNDPLQIMT